MSNFIDLLVDPEDSHLLENYTWGTNAHGHVRRVYRENGKQVTVYLHREIMGLKRGDKRMVDHINRNTLDNRRSNLRIADKSLNARNTGRHGVYFNKWQNRYYAHARVNGERHSLGGYKTREEAEQAVIDFKTELGVFV